MESILKIQKAKEYADIGIKVLTLGYTVTRVIGFRICPRKEGFALLNAVMSFLFFFNTKSYYTTSQNTKIFIDSLPLLKIEHIASLGVDGHVDGQQVMLMVDVSDTLNSKIN